MKKLLQFFLVIGLVAVMASLGFAQCTTIQDGTIVASDGSLITTGEDDWGYNYQAHLFNGNYCDAYRNAAWCQEFANDDLIMKWNPAWLSNSDCDGDGKLDRHFGFTSYKGSGAWLTNHQSGYAEVAGKMKKWTYFCKIVAVPEDAVLVGSNWYTADGELIGYSIWGEFAVIQENTNGPASGPNGDHYKNPKKCGLGQFGPR